VGSHTATIDVLANDTDADNDTLTAAITSLPSVDGELSCSAAGACTYTSNIKGGINGPVTFTYEVRDPSGAVDSATVTINVPSIELEP
jgi:hypothetical protein